MNAEALHRLAASQHGLFTRRQALGVGLTTKEIEGGARRGRWNRLHRGVYRMAGTPTTDLQTLLAAVLACGPGAMASHRGAAWLWDLTDHMSAEVAGTLRHSLPGITTHHHGGTGLRAVVRRGIPCTDPLRTVLDLAGTAEEALVLTALDRGIAGGLFTTTAVLRELERRAGKGVPGVALLRACLRQRLDGAGERTSALESAMDRIIVRHRLPVPERQHRLAGTRYRLDYAWPQARLAVETDGYGSHSGLEAFHHDRERQNAIVLAGWTVLRFTWQDVQRRPGAVADQIRRALSASRPGRSSGGAVSPGPGTGQAASRPA